MKSLFKEYFLMNKRERRGTLALTALLLMMVFFYFLRPYFVSASNSDFTQFEAQIDAFTGGGGLNATLQAWQVEPVEDDSLFYFDPNNLPEDQWIKLGLTEKQVKVIHNYESKGGKFYRKTDLQKMYSIDDFTYHKLEPWIQLEEKTSNYTSDYEKKRYSDYERKNYPNKYNDSIPPYFKKEFQPKPWLKVNVNLSDTSDWKQLNGIGKVFAKRIVDYRNKLGGFLDLEQVREVWGLSDTTWWLIRENLVISPKPEPEIRKINVNTADYLTLVSHPYIDRNLANSLIMIRSKHGPYKSLEALQKSDLVNEEIYLKIAPYLKVASPHDSGTY